MSLKDDFLEALRSVKRDFFKDYEYTETTPGHSPVQASADASFRDNFKEMFPPRDDSQADNTAFSDTNHSADVPDEALPYSPAAGLQQFASESWAVHTEDTDDDENLAPDVDPTPYRTVALDGGKSDGPGSGGGFGGSDEPPGGGRMIFGEYENGESLNDEKTIISKNTIIRGALHTEDSVRMFGQILGDIDCKSNILVAGKVRGNTSAANAYVIDAQVDGNLLCDDVVNITDDAWILGNIRAQQAEIDGKIKGNIEIRHTISIGSNSSVIGNISTDELEIKRGAFVNGQIMMYSPSRDVIDRFDQFER